MLLALDDLIHATRGLDDPFIDLAQRQASVPADFLQRCAAHGLDSLHGVRQQILTRTPPEEQPDGTLAAAPFGVLPPHLLHEARRVARACVGRLLRLLGLDQRNTPIPDRPCPWRGGELALHTGPDETSRVTCSTGLECEAPVLLDEQGRREWGWHDLLTLVSALTKPDEHAPAA
ncbi:hypothetical protein AB0A70_00500 [Streptomyces morookaense]|uniref:hypothetical protein n=1 Tax=Streptomyces morookaense TaxID=1970 RepID=UPI0033E66E44